MSSFDDDDGNLSRQVAVNASDQPQTTLAPTNAQARGQELELTEATLAAIAQRLDALQPRHAVTLRDAMERLAPAVWAARERGLASATIAAELRAAGVSISNRTLARYVASARAKPRKPRAAAPASREPR
jgi:hypothetical protein